MADVAPVCARSTLDRSPAGAGDPHALDPSLPAAAGLDGIGHHRCELGGHKPCQHLGMEAIDRLGDAARAASEQLERPPLLCAKVRYHCVPPVGPSRFRTIVAARLSASAVPSHRTAWPLPRSPHWRRPLQRYRSILPANAARGRCPTTTPSLVAAWHASSWGPFITPGPHANVSIPSASAEPLI